MRAHVRLLEKLEGIGQARRALRLVWASAPGWTLVNLALIVVQAVVPLAGLYVLKLVVDLVSGAVRAPGVTDFEPVLIWLGALTGIGLLSAGARSLASLAGEAQGLLVTDHVLRILHEQSMQVDLGYYEDPSYHDTLHRAQNEAPFRPTRILNDLLQLCQSALTLVGIVALLSGAHLAVVALLVAAALPGLAVRFHFADRTHGWQRRRTSLERRSMYLDRLLVEPWHAKEVRLFGIGATLIRRFRALRDRLRVEKLALSRGRAVADVATQAVAAVAVFGSYALIAYGAYQGSLTLGDLVMYFGAVQRGHSLFQSVFSALGNLYEDGLFLSHLDEFLSVEPRVVAPSRPRPVPEPVREGLALERVGFRYPRGGRPVLEDVSLSVRPGEMVALVGRNGSGKTTLVKLLCRLYDPSDGVVTLDGVDVRQFRPEELRRRITVLFQDFARYQLTARENIWFGDVSRAAGGGGIRRAADRAGVTELIDSLPRGYRTTLGYWFEDGQELSSGEWQKIALARAFFRDAPILILDEPTSALDPRAEARFFQEVRQLASDRAILIISHRFSTVTLADTIYVLDAGRIVERGTHEELVRRDGLYTQMFHAQSNLRRGTQGRAEAVSA